MQIRLAIVMEWEGCTYECRCGAHSRRLSPAPEALASASETGRRFEANLVLCAYEPGM
jgi:hypothetical protein